ncbi:hypothetical protein [Moraxella oblonga]|uniref:hypothetical protein n=1 Tax=Moraxella oblonga TaxID=200413 RepID=UPI00082CBBD8|nr:hypothetical protein [Moraxella oblonga]
MAWLALIRWLGICLIVMSSTFGTFIAFVWHGSKYGFDARIKLNLWSVYALPFWFFVAGVVMLVSTNRYYTEHHASNTQIVMKCGVVYGYYPKNPPNPNAKRSGRNGEPQNAMTLTVDGKNLFYPIPLDFKRLPVGTSACFNILDASKTKGIEKSRVLSLVENP